MTDVVNIRDFEGGVLPSGHVRICRPGPWGNPFRAGRLGATGIVDRATAIALFRDYAVRRLAAEPHWLDPLRGRTLACWCKPLPCHGDVLAEMLEALP